MNNYACHAPSTRLSSEVVCPLRVVSCALALSGRAFAFLPCKLVASPCGVRSRVVVNVADPNKLLLFISQV